jgi:hypothetical protein
MRQYTHDADIFNPKVGISMRPVCHTGSNGHHFDISTVVAHIVPYLLQASKRWKIRDAVRKNGSTIHRQTRSDAGHILLGHTHVDESVRDLLCKRVKDSESEISCKKPDLFVCERDGEELINKCVSHPSIPNSLSACATCSLVGER